MTAPVHRQMQPIVDAISTRLPTLLGDLSGLLDQWGKFLERVHLARIDEGYGPRGEKHDPLSPLTKDIYAKLGISRIKPGGPKLRGSLVRGGPGNLYSVEKSRITYGSNLQANGVYVIVGYQDDYHMPKDAGDEEAAQKIRNFMRAVLGPHDEAQGPVTARGAKPKAPGYPPGRGGQLHHPARVLIGLEEPHDRQLENLTDVWLEAKIDEALEGIAA